MAASNHALKIEQEDLEPEPLVGAGDTGRSIKLPLGNPWTPWRDFAVGGYRSVYRFLGRHALTRATRAVPRTIGFLRKAVSRGEVTEGLARPAMTVELIAHVAFDEALLAMALAPSRLPGRSDYHRVGEELGAARTLFARRGWLANPASYHRLPPALEARDVVTTRGWANGIGYERITWESEFEPRGDEPGGDRWQSFSANKSAAAALVRHPEPDRPWIVAVHGFCMGFPFMDFQGLHVSKLHRELGLNVALPILPLHGSRRATRISGEPFMSFDLMNAVHGLSQSIWDIRRLISWIRAQGATSIGLYGVSLGGYVSSILSGIEDGLSCVIAGIPVSDFPSLYQHHSPRPHRARAIEHNIMGGNAEDVCRVVSPFSYSPRIPRDRRFIFAGYGDRLATPHQAQRLWEHWERPSIAWYPGSHVGYLWSRQVNAFVGESLTASGMSIPAAEE